MREAQNQILEVEPLFSFFKLYFRFQFVSNSSREKSLRSVCSSIQFNSASRNSLSDASSFSSRLRLSSLPENIAPNSLPAGDRDFIPDFRQSPQWMPSNKEDS